MSKGWPNNIVDMIFNCDNFCVIFETDYSSYNEDKYNIGLILKNEFYKLLHLKVILNYITCRMP